MKNISLCSLLFALFAAPVFGAGTYYNGGYQSPQQAYRPTGYSAGGYYNQGTTGYAARTSPYASSSGYSRYGAAQTRQQQAQPAKSQSGAKESKKGFYLDGNVSRETAMWQFEMKESGSALHYDNISWNVFEANGGYDFDLGNTTARVSAGVKFGMQSGESSMVDDDITNGGYFITQWVDDNDNVIGNQIGHALSVGTSSGGSIFGFNIAFGLTDFFSWGKAKITPSIGYRSFGYKLKTNQNFGLAIDTAQCFDIDGEIQCDPVVIIDYGNGNQQILWRDDVDVPMQIVDGAGEVDVGGTYYYQQPGTSHSYETTWAGPYAALDIAYEINQHNSVAARVELGMPGYSSVGDQPYRFDWQHPKSVEDDAGIGSAMHLGLGADWKTALTDTIMLTIGLTYDYYTVSGANAKTYLSGAYYIGVYNDRLTNLWGGSETAMLDPDTGDKVAINIKNLEAECPGWVCSQNGEISSFYKSMGIRVGLAAKF
ncbi:MAG: hypothetical protein LBD50_03070 [Rickettsiales bacterium]|jgi:hypothetical protein|nr:hypothetical protein [Rickettsiales bacterium]